MLIINGIIIIKVIFWVIWYFNVFVVFDFISFWRHLILVCGDDIGSFLIWVLLALHSLVDLARLCFVKCYDFEWICLNIKKTFIEGCIKWFCWIHWDLVIITFWMYPMVPLAIPNLGYRFLMIIIPLYFFKKVQFFWFY